MHDTETISTLLCIYTMRGAKGEKIPHVSLKISLLWNPKQCLGDNRIVISWRPYRIWYLTRAAAGVALLRIELGKIFQPKHFFWWQMQIWLYCSFANLCQFHQIVHFKHCFTVKFSKWNVLVFRFKMTSGFSFHSLFLKKITKHLQIVQWDKAF